jgi:hypothetical protein
MRQEYLMSNTLAWFKGYIIGDLSGEKKEKDFIEDFLKNYVKGIFPNIAKTGIDEIDEDYQPKEEEDNSLGLGSFGMGKPKKPFKFSKYVKKDIEEFRDIDSLLSEIYEKKNSKDQDKKKDN